MQEKIPGDAQESPRIDFLGGIGIGGDRGELKGYDKVGTLGQVLQRITYHLSFFQIYE